MPKKKHKRKRGKTRPAASRDVTVESPAVTLACDPESVFRDLIDIEAARNHVVEPEDFDKLFKSAFYTVLARVDKKIRSQSFQAYVSQAVDSAKGSARADSFLGQLILNKRIELRLPEECKIEIVPVCSPTHPVFIVSIAAVIVLGNGNVVRNSLVGKWLHKYGEDLKGLVGNFKLVDVVTPFARGAGAGAEVSVPVSPLVTRTTIVNVSGNPDEMLQKLIDHDLCKGLSGEARLEWAWGSVPQKRQHGERRHRLLLKL